mgnify:CR=1 FL=1
MDAFDYAFNQTLNLEGIYSDDSADRGGRTKYGITEIVFQDALRRGLISGVSDIRDLTTAQAKGIYKTDYWLRIRLHEILNVNIAAEIFDTAVNMGRNSAIKIAQESLNFLGEDLVIDGIIGLKTIEALNRWSKKDERALFVCLNGFQFMKYVGIIKYNLTQIKFAMGWTKRIQQLRRNNNGD